MPFHTACERMIKEQLVARGISDPRILDAFRKVPREAFLAPALQSKAYEDCPLPIGHEQTISQPYVVALMTESLVLEKGDRVLEVGTGSGYQTAILAELVREVYSVELIKALHLAAGERLDALRYSNIRLKYGNGQKGWPEYSPFDKIIVTAAAREVPMVLIEQLREGGFMVIPVGEGEQDLLLGRKEKGVLVAKYLIPVKFVPLKNNVSS
ncbi:MAG: protein-L-isoaspartate(D-aspartate) O-methyltransferase [Candidatus Omnitrophica bacterium]|nr:protein-L-isoaspartate(D-aspartate) O-methyltransferase [Candidatus Omnitrophota bacterium]